MTTPAQPQIAWQATTPAPQPGDITTIDVGGQDVTVRVTAVQASAGGVQVTGERIEGL